MELDAYLKTYLEEEIRLEANIRNLGPFQVPFLSELKALTMPVEAKKKVKNTYPKAIEVSILRLYFTA